MLSLIIGHMKSDSTKITLLIKDALGWSLIKLCFVNANYIFIPISYYQALPIVDQPKQGIGNRK